MNSMPRTLYLIGLGAVMMMTAASCQHTPRPTTAADCVPRIAWQDPVVDADIGPFCSYPLYVTPSILLGDIVNQYVAPKFIREVIPVTDVDPKFIWHYCYEPGETITVNEVYVGDDGPYPIQIKDTAK